VLCRQVNLEKRQTDFAENVGKTGMRFGFGRLLTEKIKKYLCKSNKIFRMDSGGGEILFSL
jgi:hypothetical protein